MNSETCSSVRESAYSMPLVYYLESCQQAGAVLISKAGYRSGRAARGSRTMLIVWGGLAEEERSSAEDNRQIGAGYCGGIYRPGVVCEGGLAVFAAGELVELAVRLAFSGALLLGEGNLRHLGRPERQGRMVQPGPRPQCSCDRAAPTVKATIH